jgi:magnesium transporter
MARMAEKGIDEKEITKLLYVIDQPETVRKSLEEARPGDVAELIEKLTENEHKIKLFKALDDETASEILPMLNDENREIVTEEMSVREISEIVEEMDSDDAADFVAELPEEQKEELLAVLPAEESAEVRTLLTYPEESAGGIMQLELVSLREGRTCHDAIETIRSKADEVEELHNVFVTDSNDTLSGVVPLQKLILNSADTPLKEIMDPDPVSVNVMEDREAVVRVFRKYDIVSLPVVDDAGRLMGRILHDDVLDVITESDTEDLLKAAGTDEEEFESASWINAARSRLPWLLSSLLGGLVMAAIIGGMGAPLKQTIALAAFIPVILAMGGNVSTQSSAIVVRGLALGKINGSGIWRFLLKELRVGLAMAASCGLLIGITATFMNENPMIGVVVGISMATSMSFASILGTTVPLILNKMKADPVLGAGPVVLTMADISGLIIYFAVAAVMLEAVA